MRILNTDELRFVYGGHGGHNHGKKKGHAKAHKHACPTTTRRASTTDHSTTRRKKHHKA